jgi:RNA polymerase sigma-70 factor (ECF subfamily)
MPMTMPSVDDVLDGLKKGDPEALAVLFTRYRDQLRRMVSVRLDHRLCGRVSPSDILQEAYIDALQRIEHYSEKPEMPVFVWLRWIVGQRLIDVHRQHLEAQLRDASQEISLNWAVGPSPSSMCLAGRLVGNLTSPSQAALRNEILGQLEETLNRMDPIDREILTLRHFEELSNHEVAAVLGIEKAAASKRYVRALARLKDALTALPGFLDDMP